MNKVLVAVFALLLVGGAYWFYTDSQREGAAQVPSQESAKSTDANQFQSSMMTGTWRSDEDAKFTRTFEAQGTVTDRYEGDASATATGSWSVVDAAAEAQFIDVPLANLEGLTVVKIAFEEGNYYFTINTITETQLVMTYLGGRGAVLAFTKVK
ncbi:MAG: hypothetical protein HYS26_01925 [Candidatus Kaiserbacteria bacterium]|nr:MAG: hypothetical protein HYS26_01925 [Candidatus Kaiserbacteria bacterium]